MSAPRPILLLLALGTATCIRLPTPADEAYSTSLARLPQPQRLATLLPLSWVHVPKTGAAIMNAALHLPGVCGNLSMMPWDQLCSAMNPTCNAMTFAQLHGGMDPVKRRPGSCVGMSRYCWHNGWNTEYNMGHKGHGLIMLRQPEQRLMAGYYNPNDHHGWRPEWGEPESIEFYAKVVQGVSVKMLARDGGHYWVGPPTWEETERAMARLRDGFAFVGITEEYELSVCLLHAMFGNECHVSELSRWHTSAAHKQMEGKSSSHSSYNLTDLNGFRDTWDRAVFTTAMRIFKANLQAFNVSKESCEPCFLRGQLSAERKEQVGRFVDSWDPAN